MAQWLSLKCYTDLNAQSVFKFCIGSSSHDSTMLVGKKNVDMKGNQECVATLCDLHNSVCLNVSQNKLQGRTECHLSMLEVKPMLKQLYP